MMFRTWRKPKHRLFTGTPWQSEKGQSIIEAAIIVPLLFLLIFSIVEFSILFYVYQSMEHGISEATRYGVTGQQQPDPANPGSYFSRDESIKRVMREYNPIIVLDDSCFTFEHLSGSTWTAGSGEPAEIFRITVDYSWRPITPLIGALFSGGRVSLRVSSTMKNEGYPTP
jgi:hypothetical protein